MSKQLPFVDQIRRALRESGQSEGAVARATGIDKAVISRFLSCKAFPRESALNRLAAHLGLKIIKTKG